MSPLGDLAIGPTEFAGSTPSSREHSSERGTRYGPVRRSTESTERGMAIITLESPAMRFVRRPFSRRVQARTLRRLGYGNSDPATNGELKIITDLPKAPVVFDVGAHHGDYASGVLQQRPASVLHCFEPSSRSFRTLTARLGERATLHNVALADHVGNAAVFADYEGSVGTSLYLRQLSLMGIEFAETETVAVTTLDEICNRLHIDCIDLLKLDAEGAEAAILCGAKRLISSRSIARIVFEYGGTALDSHSFVRDFYRLLGETYDLFRVLPNGLLRLGEYQPAYEIADYSNICALLKQR
jgi:FkbM family methyltransferase